MDISTSSETQITSGAHASSPAATGLTNGTYVVVYSQVAANGLHSDIKAQIISSTGAPVGSAFTINTTTSGEQGQPSVAALDTGGFVVTWSSYGQDGSDSGIYAQRFDASGAAVGSETLINTTSTGAQSQAQVTSLSNGNYVVTWSSNQGGADCDIFQRIFNSSGAPVTSEVRVNTSLTSDQLVPDIAALSGGGYVITWQTTVADISGTKGRTVAQAYDASGNAVGSEVAVSSPYNLAVQYAPTVSGLADGTYVVAVEEGNRLLLKRYDTAGTPQNAISVTSLAPDGVKAQLISFSDNTFLVAWSTANGGMSYRQYNVSGDPIGNAVNAWTANTVLAKSASDDFIAADGNSSGGVGFIKTSVADVSPHNPGAGRVYGTAGNDTIYGGSDQNFIEGLAGNDVIYGEFGNDSIVGGGGDDTVYGNSGHDVLWGEDGNDQIVGGDGIDWLYGQEGNDVLWGENSGDTLDGGNGDDKLYGQEGYDVLLGGDGADTIDGGTLGDSIVGGAGADLLWGGAGPDTFYFQDKSAQADYIFDFNRAEGDKFALTASAFNAPVGFQLTAGVGFLSGAGVTPVAATATVFFDLTTHALWFDADGTGSEVAHVIAFLLNDPALQASDFIFAA